MELFFNIPFVKLKSKIARKPKFKPKKKEAMKIVLTILAVGLGIT